MIIKITPRVHHDIPRDSGLLPASENCSEDNPDVPQLARFRLIVASVAARLFSDDAPSSYVSNKHSRGDKELTLPSRCAGRINSLLDSPSKTRRALYLHI